MIGVYKEKRSKELGRLQKENDDTNYDTLTFKKVKRDSKQKSKIHREFFSRF